MCCNRCGDGIAGLQDQGTINLIVSTFISKYNELFREDEEVDPAETWVGAGLLFCSQITLIVITSLVDRALKIKYQIEYQILSICLQSISMDLLQCNVLIVFIYGWISLFHCN